MYVPNSRILNVIKSLLLELKTQMIINPVSDGDSYSPLFPLDKTSGQNINRERLELNDTMHQMQPNRYMQSIPPKH